MIKRIIERINSFLGSLAKVFPAAGVIKEFKDQVHASMKDLEASSDLTSLDI
jgi:hypothetical protein